MPPSLDPTALPQAGTPNTLAENTSFLSPSRSRINRSAHQNGRKKQSHPRPLRCGLAPRLVHRIRDGQLFPANRKEVASASPQTPRRLASDPRAVSIAGAIAAITSATPRITAATALVTLAKQVLPLQSSRCIAYATAAVAPAAATKTPSKQLPCLEEVNPVTESNLHPKASRINHRSSRRVFRTIPECQRPRPKQIPAPVAESRPNLPG